MTGPALRVVVAGPPNFDALDPLRERFPDVSFAWSGESPPAGLAEADVLVSFHVPERWLAGAPRLRWIHSPGAGADAALSPEVQRRGLLVTSSRGAFDQPVAEHAIGSLLALTRRLPDALEAQRRGEWLDFFGAPRAVEVAGRTMTIVGMGSIGGRIAEIASALGMRVIGVRSHPESHPAAERVVGVDGLDDALREADVLMLVLPDSPRAQGMIGRRELQLLRPGAFVVNVGRGRSLDGDAVADLVRSGRLAGAALDVTDPEPPEAGSPLWHTPGVILTGHTAGFSERHPHRQLERFGDALAAYLAGREPPGRIDPGRGY